MAWQRRRRPSLAGRRIALERKFRLNVAHYGGGLILFTQTALGSDVLPEGDAEVDGTYRYRRRQDGVEVEKVRVEWVYRVVYEATVQARMSRLFEAAEKSADRYLRKSLKYEGQLPRQIGNVRAAHQRGVSHFHYGLPAGTYVEKQWSRCVMRFIEAAVKYEEGRWSADERLRFLEAEMRGESVPRGFYGFGFVQKGNPAARSALKAAGYLARNAAGYMAGQASRHYVSSRLTRETGVTMRVLRACNWLHVRGLMIERGELDDDLLPSHWEPSWAAEVLRVYARVTAPAMAP